MADLNDSELGEGASGAGAQHRAGAPAPLLPVTNRGVIMAKENRPSVTISLHWLAVTLHSNAREVAAFLMDRLIGEFNFNPDDWNKQFITTGFSGRRYQSIHLGPYGISLYAYPHSGIHCHVEIKGDAIDQLGQLRVFEFLESLPELKAPLLEGQTEQLTAKSSARRVDIAFDHAPFTPRECYQAFLRGDIRCQASRKSYKWFTNDEGDSFYIGSRASGRMVRIYNRRGFTRVELEFKAKWADAIGRCLIADGCGEFEAFAFGLLRDFLDFVDKGTDGSISRALLLPWWEAFVGDAAKGILKPESPEIVSPLIVRTQDYLNRLAPTLHVIREGLGISLDQLCDSIEHTLRPKHHQKIAELKRGLK